MIFVVVVMVVGWRGAVVVVGGGVADLCACLRENRRFNYSRRYQNREGQVKWGRGRGRGVYERG